MGNGRDRVVAGRVALGAVFTACLLVVLNGGLAQAQITTLQLTPICGDTTNQLQAKSNVDFGINAIVQGEPGDVDLPRLNVPPGGQATIDVGKFDQVNVNTGRQQQTVSFAQCAHPATTLAPTNLAALAATAAQTATTQAPSTSIAATPVPRLASTGAGRIGYWLRLAAASLLLGFACMFVTQRRRFERINAWLTWAFNNY